MYIKELIFQSGAQSVFPHIFEQKEAARPLFFSIYLSESSISISLWHLKCASKHLYDYFPIQLNEDGKRRADTTNVQQKCTRKKLFNLKLTFMSWLGVNGESEAIEAREKKTKRIESNPIQLLNPLAILPVEEVSCCTRYYYTYSFFLRFSFLFLPFHSSTRCS
jgi:hypothetical protein